MYIGLGIVLIILGAIFALDVVTVDIPGIAENMLGWILIIGGLLAIVLSFAVRGRRTAGGYSTTRESHVDPESGSRVDRTDVDPR
jgi:uncharacterized membrane protein HdeD (DUF308 family)